MANTLNCRAVFSQIGGSRNQKQKPFELEAWNVTVLMDYHNPKMLKKLKEAISLSVYKRNISVT